MALRATADTTLTIMRRVATNWLDDTRHCALAPDVSPPADLSSSHPAPRGSGLSHPRGSLLKVLATHTEMTITGHSAIDDSISPQTPYDGPDRSAALRSRFFHKRSPRLSHFNSWKRDLCSRGSIRVHGPDGNPLSIISEPAVCYLSAVR